MLCGFFKKSSNSKINSNTVSLDSIGYNAFFEIIMLNCQQNTN